MGWGRTRTS